MIGFLLTSRPRGVDPFPGEVSRCFAGEPSASVTEVNDAVRLATWGPRLGDVHCCSDPELGLLVLSGYITSMPAHRASAEQSTVCRQLLHQVGHDPTAEACSALAAKLNGSFSIVHVAPDGSGATVITDRIATRPIWFQEGSSALAIASNPLAIAQLTRTREIDFTSVASLLLYRSQVDPTYGVFRGVRAFRGGVVAKVSGAAVHVHPWDRFRHEPDTARSKRDWTELVSDRLTEAAERVLRVSPNPVVFFSGGLDSRMTAAALCAAGGRPLLLTMGDSENLEVRVATKAAAALGCRHQVVFRDPHWYLRTLPRAVFETGGSYIWQHGHFATAYRSLIDEQDIGSAFLGSYCEAFSKLVSAVPPERTTPWDAGEFASNYDANLPEEYRPANRARTLGLLRPEVADQARERLHARIASRYEEIRDQSPDPRILVSQFTDWHPVSSHETFFNNLDLRSAGPERALMFDVVADELLRILPARMRDGAGLGSAVIRRLSPKVARVVNSNTLVPLSFPNWAHDASASIRPRLGRLRRLLFEDSHKTTGSWTLFGALYRDDPQWRTRLDELSRDADGLELLGFDAEAVRRCWTDFCAGDMSRQADVDVLLELGVLRGLMGDRAAFD